MKCFKLNVKQKLSKSKAEINPGSKLKRVLAVTGLHLESISDFRNFFSKSWYSLKKKVFTSNRSPISLCSSQNQRIYSKITHCFQLTLKFRTFKLFLTIFPDGDFTTKIPDMSGKNRIMETLA